MSLRNALDKILNNESKTKLLRVLCKSNTGWTGRQLARELGVSPTTASKFLKELVREGVVNVKGVGKSYLYSIDNKSYVVKSLLVPFFEKEKVIFGKLISIIKRALLKSRVKIESAAIFGSVVHGKETSKSDIDLFVVIGDREDSKKIEGKLDEISVLVAQDFHTSIAPYILQVRELKKKYGQNAAIIHSILKSNILILGKPLERLIV
ncbi:MAG: winged helix-turn-helix transcriptional regulator [Candidatus Omnitrophica bacterium]|nr:winged helix-turn-helix transcriptional regulator [Candidatus Omnitrophota bacterium]